MQSKILLPNMSGKIDFVGKPVKAIAYDSHKTNKRSNTIGIYTTNFVGRIWLQGSLKKEPKTDLDWFIIPITKETPYVEFNNYKDDVSVNHDNVFYNINGSYVWFRAILDRKSYLNISTSPVEPQDIHTNYIISSETNIEPHTTNALYVSNPLNPKYDPEYYPEWSPNYNSSSERSFTNTKLGNIEKVLLCY